MLRRTSLGAVATKVVILSGVATAFAGCVEPQSRLSPRVQAQQPVITVAAESPFGHYLAGRFARSKRDIGSAAELYSQALSLDPENLALLRRTFFLMLLDGRVEDAVGLAERLEQQSESRGVVTLVLTLRDFKAGDYDGIRARIETAPRSGFNAFILPIAIAWASAAEKDPDAALGALEPLGDSPAYKPFRAYHEALIRDYLDIPDGTPEAFEAAAEASSPDSLRITQARGNFLERNGRRDKARELYLDYISRFPDTAVIAAMLAGLDRGEVPPRLIGAPVDGVAETLFGAASALARDSARETARIYLQLAIYMKPDLALGHTMLGELLEAGRRWDDALLAYGNVAPASPYGWNARLRSATILDRLDRTDEAVSQLRAMADDQPKRTDALITLADILRGRERFKEAVVFYERAIERLGKMEERHWSLLYARGIALERSQMWSRAEADFLQALELKADQPLVLNYLGYSWVERGKNLDRALKMIEHAVELRPQDGYIVDSLGWVHFQLGNYERATLHLERSVELRPEDPTINDHLGDAYWRVGRQVEARFQWRRALSLEPDEKMVSGIREKLETGLGPPKTDRDGT